MGKGHTEGKLGVPMGERRQKLSGTNQGACWKDLKEKTILKYGSQSPVMTDICQCPKQGWGTRMPCEATGEYRESPDHSEEESSHGELDVVVPLPYVG